MDTMERMTAHVDKHYPAFPGGHAAWEVYLRIATELNELPDEPGDLLWVRHRTLSMMKYGRIPSPRAFAWMRIALLTLHEVQA
jgi:hypothetical protein